MNADAFLEDILAEPETLERVLDLYEGVDSPLRALQLDDVERVRFVGMGSSRYAALPVASLLRAHAFDAAAERASAALATPPAAGTLTVCVSANGKTPETVEAAERHRGTSTVVAVTNAPDSPLAEAAGVVLQLGAGDERGGVACRTFQATLAVLLLLARRVGADVPDLRPAVEAAHAIREARDAWLDPALDVLGGSVAVVAPDERISSAEQSALVFREGPADPSRCVRDRRLGARRRLPDTASRLPGAPVRRLALRRHLRRLDAAPQRSVRRGRHACRGRGVDGRAPGARSALCAPRRNDRRRVARGRAVASIVTRRVGRGCRARGRPPRARVLGASPSGSIGVPRGQGDSLQLSVNTRRLHASTSKPAAASTGAEAAAQTSASCAASVPSPDTPTPTSRSAPGR